MSRLSILVGNAKPRTSADFGGLVHKENALPTLAVSLDVNAETGSEDNRYNGARINAATYDLRSNVHFARFK